MKNCVFSVHISDNEIAKRWGQIHRKNVQRYCNKFDLDFVFMTHPNEKLSNPSPANPHYKYIYNRFYMFDLLAKYQRILYVDSDILFFDNCQNLFDLIPKNDIGYVKNMHLYQVGHPHPAFKQPDIKVYNSLNGTRVVSKNIGGGVNIFSKKHKQLLNIDNLKLNELFTKQQHYGKEFDCAYLNYITSMNDSFQLGVEYNYLYPHSLFPNTPMINSIREIADKGECKIIHIVGLSPSNLGLLRYKTMKYFDDKFGVL